MNQRMNLLKHSIFTILAVALTLASCSRQMIYSHYENVNPEGWERSEYKVFCVNIPKDGTYSETIGLRATRAYPFTDITIIVSQHIMPSDILYSDTLNIAITDKEGNELGLGINHRQIDVPFSTIPLNKDDSLYISIRHYMMKEILPGITDIGFSMERTE